MSSISRRSFTGSAALAPLARASQNKATAKPNILWVTCEDIGPHLHACGDDYSVTPNLDQLASRSALYMNAWSNAPVCAPARTTIISGVYPPSSGSEHMRSMSAMPKSWKMFPGYLRDAGYYTSNNSKEDYNLPKPAGTWDESSTKAHWRNRAAAQPFFSVFNFTITHESQIRTRPHVWEHDPAKARVPAYHPDTPEVRKDWAQYYDNITTMDKQAGRVLADLEKDGLAQDTIVFFFGDHGSGMPRSKRWPYNSGLNVCILASIPEKFRHLAPKGYAPGTRDNQLVSFVDLAPTMLSLAGIRAPDFYQGQAFMGQHSAPAPRKHIFGFRGRMDERYDCVRTVRNDRYVYIRNFMPHKKYGQHIGYMWETPTTQVWERMFKEGKLTPEQSLFWKTKPAEELYDLEADRDEVRNLADSPAHKAALDELRKANREHLLRTKDVGLLAEAEFQARAAAAGTTPYDMGHDPARFDASRVLTAAELASSLKPKVTTTLAKMMTDPDSGVRYWGAMGALMRGADEVKPLRKLLRNCLKDASASVRIAAAEALGQYGDAEDLAESLTALVEQSNAERHGPYSAMQALNAIDALGDKADSVKAQLKSLPSEDPKAPDRVRSEYVRRLREQILGKS